MKIWMTTANYGMTPNPMLHDFAVEDHAIQG